MSIEDKMSKLTSRGLNIFREAMSMKAESRPYTLMELSELRRLYIIWVDDLEKILSDAGVKKQLLFARDPVVALSDRGMGLHPDSLYVKTVLEELTDGAREKLSLLAEYLEQEVVLKFELVDPNHVLFLFNNTPSKPQNRNLPATHVLEFIVDRLGNKRSCTISKQELWDHLVEKSKKFKFRGNMEKTDWDSRRKSIDRYLEQAAKIMQDSFGIQTHDLFSPSGGQLKEITVRF